MKAKVVIFCALVFFFLAYASCSLLGQTIHFTRADPTAQNLVPNDAPGVIVDVFGNGQIQLFGTRNDSTGNLVPLAPGDTMGLDCPAPPVEGGTTDPVLCFFYPPPPPAVPQFPGERPRELRLADFDGDDCPDLIAQSYSVSSTTATNLPRSLLYFNDGTGRFVQDSVFTNMNSPTGFVGRGEGVTVADFNNDGFLDILLPFYVFTCDPSFDGAAFCPNAPQFYLLLNDGHGHFREVAHEAGLTFAVGSTVAPNGAAGEGAQAADINGDGWIDLYVGGRIMINTGNDSSGVPQFRELCSLNNSCGLQNPDTISITPGRGADEGAKFLDWNNDGNLDLVVHDWRCGPVLYENQGLTASLPPNPPAPSNPLVPSFTAKPGYVFDKSQTDLTKRNQPNCVSSAPGIPAFFNSGNPNTPDPGRVQFNSSFGMNIYDMDNDGREDIVTAASYPGSSPFYSSVVFRNTGQNFLQVPSPGSDLLAAPQVLFGFGDINGDGKIDLVGSASSSVFFLRNDSSCPEVFCGSLWIEMLGPNGEHNQQGRVVQVVPQPTPLPNPLVKYTRVVDGGSGYHTQNQYALLVGTRFNAAHQVTAYYGASGGGTVPVSVLMNPGQYARLYAPSAQYPNGNAIVFNQPPPPAPSKCMNWLQPSLSLISDQ